MSIQVFGLPVSRGVAIGRAVLVASSRVDVAHYFITPPQIPAELLRLRRARDRVCLDIERLKDGVTSDVPAELVALLDVHLMLLRDDLLAEATSGITTRSGPCPRSWKCWRASLMKWRTTTSVSARPMSSRWLNGCSGPWPTKPVAHQQG